MNLQILEKTTNDDGTVTLRGRELETGDLYEATFAPGVMVSRITCGKCCRPLEFGECWHCAGDIEDDEYQLRNMEG